MTIRDDKVRQGTVRAPDNDKPAYKIVIFDTFDERLSRGWQALEDKGCVFPQQRLGWVQSWCEVNRIKDLRIFAAMAGDRVAAIAPFRIENKGAIKILRSTPSHFGDFFDLIADPMDDRDTLARLVADSLSRQSGCNVVQIDQLPDTNAFESSMPAARSNLQEVTRAHIVQLVPDEVKADDLFDYFWNEHSKNRRTKIKKAIRLLEDEGAVSYHVVETFQGYLDSFAGMQSVYVSRWGEDLPERVYQYRNRALKDLFDAGVAKLHLIEVGGEIAGYHLGFDYNGAFYSWKEANHMKHAKASMGMLMKQYYLPKTLLQSGIRRINYMAGDYEYKQQMSAKSGHTEGISSLVYARDLRGRLYMKYLFDVNPALKKLLGKR